MNNVDYVQMLYVIYHDVPNFVISVAIITMMVLFTAYTELLGDNHVTFNDIKIVVKASYRKIVGYIILLVILDLTHVVVGKYEIEGIDLFFFHLPPRPEVYNIYTTAFAILFFKEAIVTIKNIGKLGIDLAAVTKRLDKINAKLDQGIEDDVDKDDKPVV